MSLLVEMSSLMKKHGMGVLKKATMILLPSMKMKNKQEKAYRIIINPLSIIPLLTREVPTTSSLLENLSERAYVSRVYKRFMR